MFREGSNPIPEGIAPELTQETEETENLYGKNVEELCQRFLANAEQSNDPRVAQRWAEINEQLRQLNDDEQWRELRREPHRVAEALAALAGEQAHGENKAGLLSPTDGQEKLMVRQVFREANERLYPGLEADLDNLPVRLREIADQLESLRLVDAKAAAQLLKQIESPATMADTEPQALANKLQEVIDLAGRQIEDASLNDLNQIDQQENSLLAQRELGWAAKSVYELGLFIEKLRQ